MAQEVLRNTRLEYLYRDGSNYKSWGSAIFAGAVTDDLCRRFQMALESGEFFIAHQIRLPEVFPASWPQYADDHCWHEYSELVPTNDAPDDDYARTIESFVAEIEQAALAGWMAFDPSERRSWAR